MRRHALAASLLLWAACGGNAPPGGGGADSGGPASDAGDVCAPPPEPYGTTEGRNFRPLEAAGMPLTTCDGTPWVFYGEAEGYCDSTFTVLVMSAGWCGPCRAEAGMLQAELADAYADRGVRVVGVMIQNDSFDAPTMSDCTSWVSTYGIRFPMLMDPTQVTQRYFDMGALPANLIVDGNGVIVHREYGVSAGLRSIRTRLDALLAGS